MAEREVEAEREREFESSVKNALESEDFKLAADLFQNNSSLVDRVYSGNDSSQKPASESKSDDDEPDFDRFLHLRNPLRIALEAGDVNSVRKCLRAGVRIESDNAWRSSYSGTFFQHAHAREEILTLLFESGLDPKFRNYLGENFFHMFTKYHVDRHDHNAVRVAKILMDAGVPLDEPRRRGKKGFTPLFYAIRYHNLELVRFFIENGANVNYKSVNGSTPLHLASQYEHVAIVDLLVSRGANINAKTHYGLTALHRACLHSQDEVMKLLIRVGADITLKDNNGKTPFYYLMVNPKKYSSIQIMIQEIAKQEKFDSSFAAKIEKNLIQGHPAFLKLFDRFMEELDRLASIKFHNHYSYYSVLKISNKTNKLASLTKNSELVEGFYRNLPVSCYGPDLRRIFKEATDFRNRCLLEETKLKSVFSDIFPSIVIRKLASNLAADRPCE